MRILATDLEKPSMSLDPEPRPPTGNESEVGIDSIRAELSGCVFRHVKGFFAKYFAGNSLSAAAEEVA